MLYSFLIFFFLFQWNTEVVNNQRFIYLFSYFFFLNPVNTDKERKKKKETGKNKTASPDDEKKSQLVGLNVAGFYTLGLKHRHDSR